MTREEKWELFVCFLELNDALEMYEVLASKRSIEVRAPSEWINTFMWFGQGGIAWGVLYHQWQRLERTL